MKRVAIYGGSFSPPHLGHASVIEALLRLFPCDEIWVMPSADRHDKTITASGEHRINMLQLMIHELFPDPKIKISDFELKLGRQTVTYETLKLLKEGHPGYEFHFALSSENLNMIRDGWKYGKEIWAEASFVATKNPFESLPKTLPPHITILDDIAWLKLSSTFVRKLIGQGYSGTPYITKGVSGYIKENNLYKNPVK